MMQIGEKWARRLFYQNFQGPDFWATPALWQAYQQWQGRREMEHQKAFKAHLATQAEKIKNTVNAMPNPFVNANKGEWYEIIFRLPDVVTKSAFKNLEKIGLKSASVKGRIWKISGVPLEAGEYDIPLVYIWKNWTKGMPGGVRTFKLIVNPDPRELWKDLPCDPSLEYLRPDWDFEERECHDARLVAASLRGRSHAHAALPRDDAFGLGCARGWQILAVADGAGSAPFSRKGAEIACEQAVSLCSWHLANSAELDLLLDQQDAMTTQNDWLPRAKKLAWSILPQAALEAHKAIREEAQAMERLPKQYATTLLLAAVKKCPSGWAILSFQIGDGAMVAMSPDKAMLLAQPDEGDFAGQTRFITMPEVFEQQEISRRLCITLVPDLTSLLLLTDGITDPFFGSQEALNNADLWQKLWREIMAKMNGESAESNLREWLGFWSRGNHDDRTMAILLADA